MRKLLRAAGRRVAEWLAPTVMASISEFPALQQELRQLRKRVASLEDEVQETRRLNRRVAEITDIVEEVLLPAANRDDDRLREALHRYAKTLDSRRLLTEEASDPH